MIKLNFVDDGIEVYNWSGAGVLTAKIAYGKDFEDFKKVPPEALTKLSRLITLAIATLTLQDADAATKAAKTELEAVTGPALVVPDKKLVVPA